MNKFIKKYGYFILFLGLGLLFFTYPMLKSNFDLMPGNGLDIKYQIYTLEHSFLWIKDVFPHNAFWDAPFYYPNKYIIAQGDALVGIAPIYWFFRLFFNPFSTLQIVLIVLCCLNFYSFYYLLNKQLKFSELPASVGAFVFAFSLMRYFRMLEISYFTHFFTIFAVIFLLKAHKTNTTLKNHLYFCLFAICSIMQFYSCFALGFFGFFVGFFAVLFSLIPKTSRDIVFDYLKNFYKYILFYLFVIFSMLLPMAFEFVSLGSISTFGDLTHKIMSAEIWLRNVSVLDNIFYNKFRYIGYNFYGDSSISLGVLTAIFALFGILKMKYAKGLPILILLFIYIFSCGHISVNLWKIFYCIVPLAEALDSLNRISFIALIVFSFLIVVLISDIKNKFKLTAVILLILVENIPLNIDPNSAWRNYNWSKSQFLSEITEISDKISNDCKILYLENKVINKEKFGEFDAKYKIEQAQNLTNLKAMFAANEKNIYTVNCYSKVLKSANIAKNNGLCIYEDVVDLDKI